MKNNVFKSVFIFILFIFIFSGSKVYAASASISASDTNVYVGDKVTIYVSINAGTWNLHVTGSVNDGIAGFDMDGNVTTNKSYSLNTSIPGTYTITLSGDITDYDTELTTYPNQTITVTVNQVPAQNNTESTTVEYKQETQTTNNTPNTNNSQPSNNNVQNNTKKTTEIKKEEKKQETKNEEIKEESKEEIKEVEKPKLNLTKFEIVGYELDFNEEKLEYSIDILEDLKDLYIIVEGENIEADNIGKVNIQDKDEIILKVKNKDLEKEYKIVLNRIKKNDENKKEKIITKKNKLNSFLLVSAIILLISSISLSSVLVIPKIKAKKIDKTKKDKVKKK